VSGPRKRGRASSLREHRGDCVVIRAGKPFSGLQGLSYFEGISAESAGSLGLCMHLLEMPPGAEAKPHLHEAHETAILVLDAQGRRS
jgi:uncharacterized RmlC-like cupin family protein